MAHQKPEDKPKTKNPLKQKKFRHNWRIDMLAVPKGNYDELEAFRMKRKNKGKDVKEKVNATPKTAPCECEKNARPKTVVPIEEDASRYKRMMHMALQPARVYQLQKSLYGDHFGTKFENRMDHRIRYANQSIYNEYDRARKNQN